MKFLIDVTLFWVASFISGIWFITAFFPILYGLPRSLSWVLKGKLKPKASLFYIRGFIQWNLIFLGITYLLVKYFPETVMYLYNNFGFFCGSWFGIIACILRSFRQSGRDSLNLDFWTAIKGFRKIMSQTII